MLEREDAEALLALALDPEQAKIIEAGMAAVVQIKKYHRLLTYEPYLKQAEFHRLGAVARDRALIAGNRVGKSECAGAETGMHTTGDYPPWWEGHRFKTPIRGWVAGTDGTSVRDICQLKLFGTPGIPDALGTGYIPREAIVGRPSLARGTPDLYDTVHVKCKVGGRLDDSAISVLNFKTYGEGRQGWQGDTLHWLWVDEEPPEDIFSEGLTRLATTRGLSIATFTPLLGRTSMVQRYEEPAPGRGKVQMGIFDAVKGHDPERPDLGHFTREQAAEELARYPAHERDARAYGVPMMGEGRVFLTPEENLRVPRFEVPKQLRKLWAIDFGGAGSGSHPFAAVLLAWDTEYDIIYLIHCIKMRGMTKLQHVPAMRAIAANVPVAWPHDGNEVDRGGSGETIAQQYKNPMPGMPGLRMLPDHATWPEGGFSTEAAVVELDDRTKTGRFQVFPECAAFFEEYRQFHREKGKLVKIDDDVLSAVFKGLMMKRFALPVGLGDDPHGTAARMRRHGQAADINPHTGERMRVDTVS